MAGIKTLARPSGERFAFLRLLDQVRVACQVPLH
jgi:hypothetical protein